MPPKSSPRLDAVKGPDNNKDVPSIDSSPDKTNRNILLEFEQKEAGSSAGPSHNKRTEIPKAGDENQIQNLINKAFDKTGIASSEKLEKPQTELNELFKNLHITNENTPTSTPTTSEQIHFNPDTPMASEPIHFTIGEGSEISQEIIPNTDTSNQAEPNNPEVQQEIHPAFRQAWQETTQNLEALNQQRQRVTDKAQEMTQALQEMQRAGQNIPPAIERFRQAIDRLLPRMNQDHQELNNAHQEMKQALREMFSEINHSLQDIPSEMKEILLYTHPQIKKEIQETTPLLYDFNTRIGKSLQEAKETFQKLEQSLLRINQAVPQEPQEINPAVPQEPQEINQIDQEMDQWRGIDPILQGIGQIEQGIGQGIGQALNRSIEDLNNWLREHRSHPNS